MAQGIAQATLLGVGVWAAVTVVLWLITGLTSSWRESNEVLRKYLRVWSVMWVIFTFAIVTVLAVGVSA